MYIQSYEPTKVDMETYMHNHTDPGRLCMHFCIHACIHVEMCMCTERCIYIVFFLEHVRVCVYAEYVCVDRCIFLYIRMHILNYVHKYIYIYIYRHTLFFFFEKVYVCMFMLKMSA